MHLAASPFDVDLVRDLVADSHTRRHHWGDDALCLGFTADYVPDEDETPPAEALSLCAACPVATHCLASALAAERTEPYRNGWWGGCSPDEREAIAADLGLVTVVDTIDEASPAALARRLRADNHSVAEIAAALGCNKRSVYRYLAKTA